MKRAASRNVLIAISGVSVAISSAAQAEEPLCAAPRQTIAQSSLTEAVKAINLVLKTLEKPGTKDLDKLQIWLGVNSSTGVEGLREKFTRMRAFANSVTFRCAVKTDIRIGDVYAYVDPKKSFNIVLGAFFFSAPNTGFCSKPGILVHEISHFVLAGATKDPRIYGPQQALKFAQSNPAAAQQNAENIEYFVESLLFNLSSDKATCG